MFSTWPSSSIAGTFSQACRAGAHVPCSFSARHFAAKSSSQRTTAAYIKRQTSDPYCGLAREHAYRARSAFKLLEIDDRERILKPGARVVDVGAAPGSWTQVAVERTQPSAPQVHGDRRGRKGEAVEDNKKGVVVGVDLQPLLPIPGAHLLGESDIRDRSTQSALRDALHGEPVDVVLSDMAPSPTGDKATDHTRIIALCRLVLHLIVGNDKEKQPPLALTPQGVYLCKIWDGAERGEFTDELKARDFNDSFHAVKLLKPSASRDSSAELYVLARRPKKGLDL